MTLENADECSDADSDRTQECDLNGNGIPIKDIFLQQDNLQRRLAITQRHTNGDPSLI